MSSNNTHAVDKMPDDIKAQKLGKYGAYFLPEPTQQCGYMMATMSVIMLIGGAMLETLSFDKLYTEYSLVKDVFGSYSYIAYSGYWGGAMVLACAVIAIRAASHPSDKAVGGALLASLIGITFSVVIIIITAVEWATADTINTLCRKCSAGQMLLAAYGVILSSGAFACLAAILLGILTAQTILAGRKVQPSNTAAVNETMVLPLQPLA